MKIPLDVSFTDGDQSVQCAVPPRVTDDDDEGDAHCSMINDRFVEDDHEENEKQNTYQKTINTHRQTPLTASADADAKATRECYRTVLDGGFRITFVCPWTVQCSFVVGAEVGEVGGMECRIPFRNANNLYLSHIRLTIRNTPVIRVFGVMFVLKKFQERMRWTFVCALQL